MEDVAFKDLLKEVKACVKGILASNRRPMLISQLIRECSSEQSFKFRSFC